MNDNTSYQYSILLTKAYRTLRAQVYACLEKYELIPSHWSLLGLVYRSKNEVTASDVASSLGVKLPLVTNMVNYLEGKDLVERVANETDGRSRLLVPTASGAAEVSRIEKDIDRTLAPLLDGISQTQLGNFRNVLQAIIDNENK